MQAFQNMIETLTQIKTFVLQFNQIYINLTLLMILTLWLLLKGKKQTSRILSLYCIIIFALVLNPLSYNNIKMFGMTGESYFYIFFLLPVFLLIAYVLTQLLYGSYWKTKAKIIVVAILIGLMVSNFFVSVEDFRFGMAKYKVNTEISELSMILQSYYPCRIFAAPDIAEELLEIDKDATFIYSAEELLGENIDWTNADAVSRYQMIQNMINNPYDIQNLLFYARQCQCDVLIVSNDPIYLSTFPQKDINIVGMTKSYAVIKI